jgi:hypothetical protein
MPHDNENRNLRRAALPTRTGVLSRRPARSGAARNEASDSAFRMRIARDRSSDEADFNSTGSAGETVKHDHLRD